MRKILLRAGLAAGLTMLAAVFGFLGLLNWPQVIFGHHISQSNLELWSDRPFMIASGRDVLKDVQRRLSRSPLPAGDAVRRIFIVNSDWRRRLLFLGRGHAGGLNYYPFTSNVFIRPADVEIGRVLSPSGEFVKPPRTLAYFATHEIAHSLIGERIGPIPYWLMPKWVNEGLADYIGLPGLNDREKMIFLLKSGDKSMDPEASGLYQRYRLLVTQALDREHWTLGTLLGTTLPQAEAEARLFSSFQ